MKSLDSLPHPARRWTEGAFVALLIGAAVLATFVLFAGRASVASHRVSGASAVSAGGAPPTVAYTFVPGAVAKVNATSGTVLARWLLPSTAPNPSLAVSRDGQRVFVLNREWDGQQARDRFYILDGETLALLNSLPADDFAKQDEAPALAIMSDDRIVVVYHIANSGAEWLTYFDRQTGRFSADRTALPACDTAHLVPLPSSRLAVVCSNANVVNLVDVSMHRVIGTTPLGRPRAANLPGWAIAAGPIPNSQAVAVLLDDARLLRVDPARQTVSVIANLAPGRGQLVPVDGAAFNVNGRAVVALAENTNERALGKASTLLLVDLTSGAVLNRLHQPSRAGASLSPDGEHVYVRGPNSGDPLQIIDLATHRAERFGDIYPHLVFH